MSAIGGVVGRAVGALGGPQLAAVIVAGGLLVGAVGGGLVAGAGRSGDTGPGTGELSIYPCPNVGPALQTVPAGQRFLVTGRTEDGSWARIHYPAPGRTEAWVQVSPLTFHQALSSVPVATCAAVAGAPTPSLGPGPSLTAVQHNSPSPSPTPMPTATPTPTPTPSPTPTLTKLTTSTGKISYDEASYCPKAAKRVTFGVKGSDASGLVDVTLYWRAPGSSSYTKSKMTLTSGSATNGTWQVTLDTTTNGITKPGKLAFYAIGTDTSGATRRIPTSGADAISVAVCSNTGPSIRSATASPGSIDWNPLGAGGCTSTTTISATVSDVDGVKSVTLFYRPPGSATWSTRSMHEASGKWSASVDTTKDGITIVSPPTDNLRWYIKAVDGKGAGSKSSTASVKIRRCDTEAQFDGVFATDGTYPCSTAATITIGTYANDRDQPSDGLKVVFHWTLENTRSHRIQLISGHMSASSSSGNQVPGYDRVVQRPDLLLRAPHRLCRDDRCVRRDHEESAV